MDPIKTYTDKLDGAIVEIISGMSALNMEPRPLEKPEGTFLSETDHWVKHSMEHFRQAVELIRESRRQE